MTLLRRAIWMAAKRAAADPRVQAKASEVMRDEVVPRVRTAVDLARPEIERARQNVRQAGRNVKKSIAEKSSLRDAKDFLSGFKKPPK
tara:strand:+ start:7881 stop:8144 length:264 start_codon:yes stop_codon:yes gene_type:complete